MFILVPPQRHFATIVKYGRIGGGDLIDYIKFLDFKIRFNKHL